ncbi:hypothetical protein ACFONL_11055, partial [Camelimonas fluminis]
MKGGRFQFTHDETKSLAALARIAKDMAERDLVLGDIWDIDGKQSYLDQLEHEGVLPKETGTAKTVEPAMPTEKPAVRRQNIWRRSRRKLAECGPRLVFDVRRRA